MFTLDTSGDLVRAVAYFCVQASLAFSIVLSLAFSSFFVNWRPVALITSLGCAFHLFLDSLQDKWGNGVHLVAPFDWTHFSIGIWPIEWTVTWLISLGGFAVVLFVHRLKTDAAVIHVTWLRAASVAGLLVVYFAAPLAFVDDVINSNSLYLDTISKRSERNGEFVELDRCPVTVEGENVRVKSHTGEVFTVVEAPEVIRSGTYSFKGHFVSNDRIRLSEWKAHSGLRPIASVTGLAIIAAWMLTVVFLRLRSGPPRST